ncbi:MAG: pyridoxamine 5'-phosphate oxidase family protein [Candidatus Dormibacteraeota bacterium]|uniref:Pyridoxamine 5'-phosphate oxidase family protein n=1 Tax=Candidatus Aeolococcus gillhamiae TaxID=3127015 RepID=A0A934N606_9BACT|nr:pyridoxamine 5'-phosphate oxidase family protein [Candidatus Dormibacteraeota bacterium]
MTATPNLAHGRHPERGATDLETVRAILDAERICHVAFVVDGWPYAVPTIHARDGDRLLIHGSTLSRMLGTLAGSVPVCVAVTAVDGIVCARSAFNHSMNYRSAMVFGSATAIGDPQQKLAALRIIVEHVLPGRWAEVRQPTPTELKATEIVSIPLDRATAKVRNAGSIDTPADLKRRVWSGVLPMQTRFGPPVMVAPDVADLPLPPSVAAALGARFG